MCLVWCDYYEEAKNGLSHKNCVFNDHQLICGKCKMTPENTTNDTFFCTLKVIIPSPLISVYSMNKFVTNKSKLPQDGAQVFPYMG